MPTEMEELQELSHEDLFNEANSDEPATEEVVEEAAAESVEQAEPTEQTQARDEQGRFAAETPAAATPAQEEQPRERIPLAEYLSEREKRQNFENELKVEREQRQALERRLADQTRPAAVVQEATKPDPLLDPEGYEKYLETKFEEKLLNNHRETSLAQAHRTYKGEFEEAYAAAQKQVDPALKARMQQSRDPGETLMEWHREQKTRAEVGNDPNAYFNKRFEEFLKDPANQAKVLERIRGEAQPGATKTAPTTSLPPSLTRTTSASREIAADDDDLSNDGLWRHANA